MIRFGAIVSVVAVAMGLLIVGAVAGDLTLVYVSIGLAALALLMLIAAVVVWRDEIFDGASSKVPSPMAAAAPTELASTGAGGARAAAGMVQATRLAQHEHEAAAGQSARRRGGGETAAASSGRTAATSGRAEPRTHLTGRVAARRTQATPALPR